MLEMTNERDVVVEEARGAYPEDELLNFDLRVILAAVRRNIIWVAAILAASLVLGLVVSMLMVPRYQASAQVLVEQNADQIIEGGELAPLNSWMDADRFLRTQVDVIQSVDLAQRVVEADGLATDPAFFEAMGSEIPTQEKFAAMTIRPASLADLQTEVAAGLLREALTVELPAESRLVTITIETRDPRWSARLANAYADNYIAGNLSRKFDSSSYARDYLAQQLEEARSELEESERELNQYSRIAGLVRIPGQGENGNREGTLSITTNSLVQLNEAAGSATADRVLAENTWEAMANVPVLNIPQVLSNSAMQALIRQRSEIESLLAQERARHLEDHPNVVALRAQVDDINEEIESLGQSLKRSIYLTYQAAREREEALQQRVQRLTSAALEEQDLGVRFNVLQREAETKRALYDTLLARYNALNATAGAASNNISLVDIALVPRSASSPNLPLNLAFALLLGLTLAGFFIFLREYFDDSIRVPDDVERKLGLSLLGLVPNIDGEDIQEELADPKSPVSEAYATLLTNLRFATPTGIPEVLAVTSAQQAEGKSITSLTLAENVAEFGKRVLLVDADMRRPTLHRQNVGDVERGLAAYLSGEAEFEDVVNASSTRGLDYVTALPMPPDPVVLLGNARIEQLIAKARENYDCVILDCPPLLGLSDTAILTRHADNVLMVVDATAGHRGSVKSAIRRLRLINASIIGAILTKFDFKSAGKEYSYSYYRYED